MAKGHGSAKRGIPPKDDFNAWYPAIVEIADLVDKRYPIKGMDVWKPYGWSAMGNIDSIVRTYTSNATPPQELVRVNGRAKGYGFRATV